MNKKQFVVLLLLPCTIDAFSSISLPYNGVMSAPTSNNPATLEDIETAPWRVVLDIGREPLSTMPFDWARSGCRMPLVVPCDFTRDSLQPQSDTVSFTGPGGAVIRPIQGGHVQLKNDKELKFTLSFPETLAR